jgi:glycosyltransferase involved in cell wall biosynthesis
MGLHELGNEVEVLTQVRYQNRALPRLEKDNGVVIRRFLDWTRTNHFPVAPSLWKYMRAHGQSYDLVHAHSFHAAPALMVATATHEPYIFTPHYHGVGHTPMARATHLVYDPISRYAFRRASAIICVSSAEAEMVRERFPQTADRIHVVPNGVDLVELEDTEPYDLDHSVVLAVGRFERYKQVDRVIDAFNNLDGDCELVLIGEGSEYASLARQAELSRGRVTLLGRVDDAVLRRWQRTAAVVISLSLYEAFGLVVAEGLAAGASVVASDIPAHREITRSSLTRVELVDPNATTQEIASALRRALDRERQTSGNSNRPSWDDASHRIRDIYLQTLEKASH